MAILRLCLDERTVDEQEYEDVGSEDDDEEETDE